MAAIADFQSGDYHAELPKLSLRPPSSGTIMPHSDEAASPPFTRDSSPSPNSSPLACPALTRSFSASEYSSAASTISQPSVVSRSSSASAALRQRGYVRPQGVSFAPSAGNRDSVLSLGSIAHLQYYFARTGLLDGKGAQLAKDDRGKPGVGKDYALTAPRIRPLGVDDATFEDGGELFTEEPSQYEEPVMLPPTVSTYSHRTPYVPPPPDSETLRNDLKKSLVGARKALEEASADLQPPASLTEPSMTRLEGIASPGETHVEAGREDHSQASGWHEIQGIHILDVVTLAIRAAKVYYTSHDHPHRLYSIRSERRIREELLETMEVLKKMASRNFAGGIRHEELTTMISWVDGIENLLKTEAAFQAKETAQRASWTWSEGSWEGNERGRERQFLSSFHDGETLPTWDPVDPLDPQISPFLDVFRTGLALVHIHNRILKHSKRQFAEIKFFHTDLAKPYRCAENLRYWLKAAELRWETKLTVDVSGIVNGKLSAFVGFDAAMLQWSSAVRGEMTREWMESSTAPTPELQVE